MALAEEVIERGGGRLRWQLFAQIRGQLDDPRPPLGRAQNPTQQGKPLLLQISRGHPVGGDHEVFDELLGPIPLGRRSARCPATRHGLQPSPNSMRRFLPPFPHRCAPVLNAETVIEPVRDNRFGAGPVPSSRRRYVVGTLGVVDTIAR